jgi:alkylation response protein AidB-like acyl-CoA dehydrogenase
MTLVQNEPLASIELSSSVCEFQQEVRAWLEANAPAKLKGVHTSMGDPDLNFVAHTNEDLRIALEEWAATLYEAGYMCVAWPKGHGGRGLTDVEVAVLNEEFHRANVPRLTRGYAEVVNGPSIMAIGTPEQKAYFLPRIVSGEDIYCQGFSEPGAGSDLAGIRTKGVVEGDEIVINGQKVWTSTFWKANMIICLCRTDDSAPRHQGLSYVLLPIKDNGIEFRPIRKATGEAEHYAETFITNARAPLFNVIGGVNNGWKAAMANLGGERGGATTQYLFFQREFWSLVAELKRRGKLQNPRVREMLAWAYSNVSVMRMDGLMLLNALVKGEPLGRNASESVHKLRWSEYEKRLGEFALDALGANALVTGVRYELSQWQLTFVETRDHTIWGGSSEIQRNIIAERVLGLPREPRA